MARSGFWAGVLTAFVVLVLVAVAGAYSGIYDVSATRPHGRVVRWFLGTAAVRSIRTHAKADSEIRLPNDDRSLTKGYASYDGMCVSCHGGPGVPRDWVGEGMEPSPPDLQKIARARKPEEIYWVIKNGIKSAGMPALSPTHDDEEIRDVAAFVTKLGAMSKREYSGFRKRTSARDGENAR